MRFTFAEAMTDPSYYIPLAQAAEAAGYDGMTIADSLAYPYESDAKYPYTPDGNREFLEGKPFIEALTLTAALGAVTSTLRFNKMCPAPTAPIPILVGGHADAALRRAARCPIGHSRRNLCGSPSPRR
ncbi:putative oxidoreductase [Mycobacteroides abscessus subsp. abscessus]|nr:putative oxidoreductase [Mycobacteroides abscessus subsp. abscessus]